ncbi:hypothetical protein [Rhodovulum marinum]|uniref:Uncharacterized protein n=1 Tax=Rhodovulum marinum TaxID=320662 RepID=A0A4R2PQI6_9RHOB|nr:hypothetical protein [Rhodovulum marinum]TCP38073.1 hypothetical protein EV662_12217 [Rhodovulum marinum]
MAEFDPNSSEVNPRGEDGPATERAESTAEPDSSHASWRKRFLTLFDLKITRFLGLWAIITVLLIEFAQLLGRPIDFRANPSGVLAVTFVAAIVVRYLSGRKITSTGILALADVMARLLHPVRRLLGTAWTFLLLGFVLVFVTQCSQNPGMPVENIFILAIDRYWTWLQAAFQKLFWYFGWS